MLVVEGGVGEFKFLRKQHPSFYALRCFFLSRWRQATGWAELVLARLLRRRRRGRNVPGHQPRCYRILLSGHGLNSIPYLRDAREALEETGLKLDIRLFIQTYSSVENYCDQIARLTAVRKIGSFRANIAGWDLMIFAKHPGVEVLRAAAMADAIKVYLSHGIETGKLIEGRNYTYDRVPIRNDGKPIYDLMLAKSQSEIRLAQGRYPSLGAMKFEIIGDVLLDRLLGLQRQRITETRAQLNLDPGKTTVLIASTWGHSSLIYKIGRELVAEALGLSEAYQFVISVHQQVWMERTTVARELCQWLKGISNPAVRVLDPLEDWIPWLAASDLAIADHTSLGLYFAHLGRPIIHYSTGEDELMPGWPADRIRSIAPRLRSADELAARLGQVSRRYPYAELHAINADSVQFPGEGRQRLRRLLGTLLCGGNVA